MVLNYDVLIAVMAFSDRCGIGRLMQTCRTLYLAGSSYILDGEVSFSTRGRLISFCRFMLRDPPNRFWHLRELELGTSGRFKNPQAGELIADLFIHAKHLRTLRLLHCDYLELSPRVFRALADMTSLRDLTLISLSDEAYDLLPELQSPLMRIECSFYNNDTYDPADPISLLAPFKNSLKEMKVTWVEFASLNVRYLHVTDLYVDDCRFAELRYIFHAFPNLRRLSLWMGQEDDELDAEEVEDHRAVNTSAHAQSPWKSLCCVCGSLLSLYMLGVRCKVECLSLESSWVEKEDSSRFIALLSDMQPSSVSIRLRDSTIDLASLGGLLSPVTGVLSAITLHVDFEDKHWSDPSSGIVSCLFFTIRTVVSLNHPQMRMLSTLHSFTLTSLRMCLDWTSLDTKEREAGSPSLQYDLDLNALAQQAMNSMQTLRYFCIDVVSRCEHWEIQDGQGNMAPKRLVKLSSEVGRRIMSSSFRHAV